MSMPPLPPGPSGRSNVFGLATARPGAGVPDDVVVDVSDVVPSPGDVLTVACQVVDDAGNGVAKAGVAIDLTLTGGHSTLGSASLTSLADGSATTTLTIDSDAPANTRISVSGALA